MSKILVVEDNIEYLDLLSSQLEEYNFSVDKAESPVKGLELVALNQYDLVISDLNLPVMSGVMFTEAVKNISPQTACIILTGDPDELSEVESIEKNIDLYIDKSKSVNVIVTYIRKLINENKENPQGSILISRNENISLDTSSHTVTKEGKEVDLTPKEYEILRMFLSHKGEVITREMILEEVWHEPVDYIEQRVVDSHVKNLRDKIKSVSIMTIRGYGYKWNE